MTGPFQNSWGQVDETLALQEQQTVTEIISRGRTLENALEVGLSALILSEHLIRFLEAQDPLPRPVACMTGCNFCCYNLVELTPPEALLLGHYIESNFSQTEKTDLLAKIATLKDIQAGLSKAQLTGIRQQLPCPLLKGELCRAYPARPLICRAMHSLNADKCEIALKSETLVSDEFYLHRHTIAHSISRGLRDGCRAMGCQGDSLSLTQALEALLTQPRPALRWIRGEAVFPVG